VAWCESLQVLYMICWPMTFAILTLPCVCACNSSLSCSLKIEGPCSRMLRKDLSCPGTEDVNESATNEPLNGSWSLETAFPHNHCCPHHEQSIILAQLCLVGFCKKVASFSIGWYIHLIALREFSPLRKKLQEVRLEPYGMMFPSIRTRSTLFIHHRSV